jgi:hypothetical protein
MKISNRKSNIHIVGAHQFSDPLFSLMHAHKYTLQQKAMGIKKLMSVAALDREEDKIRGGSLPAALYRTH